MGKSPKTDHANKDIKTVKNLTIRFDKIIETNFTASGTLRIQKKNNYLILYDGHVDAFRLACLDYSTGTEIWKVPYNVRGYWFYEDKVIAEGHDNLEMFEIKTGKSIWKVNGYIMRFGYGEGQELDEEVCVTSGGKDAILHLKDGNITGEGKNLIGGFLFKQDIEGKINKKGIVLENKYGLSDQFYRVVVVEDRETARDIYVWTLDNKTRTFTLAIYGHNDVLFKKHKWTIPNNTYMDNYEVAFSGLPEPEKLQGSIYCLRDVLIFYESYENYRWSWGRGCNRITAIDLYTNEIKYQVWGQSPSDKNFLGFHFFNNQILMSNGVMHFQEGPSTFYQFDEGSGKMLDSLSKRFTLFRELSPEILVGFIYERKQVKDTEYTNKVSIAAWDHSKNEFSKLFDFDFKEQYPYEPYVNQDGTIIFDYYDRKLGKDVLYCCKIIPGL